MQALFLYVTATFLLQVISHYINIIAHDYLTVNHKFTICLTDIIKIHLLYLDTVFSLF